MSTVMAATVETISSWPQAAASGIVSPSSDNSPIKPEHEHVPSPASIETHTMGESLFEYLRIKLDPDVTSRTWSKILVLGRHSRSAPSRIMPIEKPGKPFNWQRPTSRINGDVIEIEVFPGHNYILQYAECIATYLSLHGADPGIVRYILPTKEEMIAPLLSSNLQSLGKIDVAVLGYVQALESFVGDVWEGGDRSRELFGWQVKTMPNGCRVAFVGCMVSYWGDIAGNVVRTLKSLCKVKCVLYIGKLGSLHARHVPNTVLATGNCTLVNGEMLHWDNVLESALRETGHDPEKKDDVVKYGVHCTLGSVLQETKVWLKEKQEKFDWVEPEVGHMALAARECRIRFGYLHIVSDNLAKKYAYDLSNEREQRVLDDRKRVVSFIEDVLAEFFAECDARDVW